MRILILDDQPGLADTLSLSLRFDGHSATCFTCPKEALEAIYQYDVLVAGHQIQEMTGLEIARRAYAQGWRGRLLLTRGRDPASIGETIEHPFLRMILPEPTLGADACTGLKQL